MDSGEVRCVLCGANIPSGKTKCQLCGTEIRDSSLARTSSDIITAKSAEILLRDKIPTMGMPMISNTCPGCAMEIANDLDKCPRCGVPLKSPADIGKGVQRKESFSSPARAATAPSIERVASSVGLVNGRGMTNGARLINGRAMSNGAGLVNGSGLVNGTGMINGARYSPGASSGRSGKSTFLRKWQFIAILVAIAIVLPTFMLLSYDRTTTFAVDGDFGEWAHIAKFGMQEPADLPEVTVDEWAVKTNTDTLFLYAMTATDFVGTSNIDSFFLFVDADGDAGSGYSVAEIGAEYLMELHGWDHKVESASLLKYGPTDDSANWTSWSDIGPLAVATKADKMEAQADLPIALTSAARFVFLAQDNLPQRASSVSYPVPEYGGVLIIVQEEGNGINTLTGLIQPASSVSLARLSLICEGVGGDITMIEPVVSGANLVSQIIDISLSPGDSNSVDIMVDTAASPSKSLVSAKVLASGVSSTFSEVTVLGDPVCAYVSEEPDSIRIDGAFGDWIGHTVSDSDISTVANPNVDINGVGSVNGTSETAFYVSVRDQIFMGSYVPADRGKPTSQGGGGGEPVIPRRKSGEDVLRVYIDSDLSNSTGELVQRSKKSVGADYLLEIEGLNGVVTSKSLMIYSAGTWIPLVTTVSSAVDSQRIELSVSTTSIGGTMSFTAIVETTDWRTRSDWAWTGGIPDPWVIDANGTTYTSTDGSTWVYLSTPTLQPGDRIVDISISIGAQAGTIFIVTNTGRTFYWDPATSISWTEGQTIPIDIATYSEAVSMTFYQNSAAWLLTKNGSYFWLMDASASKKSWTYQDTIAPGVTDFTDLYYTGGTMYALRSGPNTVLNYSNNGNTFISQTSPTGSTSNHSQVLYISGGPGSADDRIFVLCENGNIRYSANGGVTWSALGNLPVPTGGNTTVYTDFGIDPAGYMWVVTDTGYTYKSTDTTTYGTFTCMGRAPISPVVAALPEPSIPEFPAIFIPVLALISLVILPRIRSRKPR